MWSLSYIQPPKHVYCGPQGLIAEAKKSSTCYKKSLVIRESNTYSTHVNKIMEKHDKICSFMIECMNDFLL